MRRNSSPPRKGTRALLLIVALAIFGTALILGTRSVVQVECELCVTFHGMTTCRRGSGADADEAQRAAQKAACAVMAAGMNESIACDNTPPTNVQCTTGD
jgi:hypothetical protein